MKKVIFALFIFFVSVFMLSAVNVKSVDASRPIVKNWTNGRCLWGAPVSNNGWVRFGSIPNFCNNTHTNQNYIRFTGLDKVDTLNLDYTIYGVNGNLDPANFLRRKITVQVANGSNTEIKIDGVKKSGSTVDINSFTDGTHIYNTSPLPFGMTRPLEGGEVKVRISVKPDNNGNITIKNIAPNVAGNYKGGYLGDSVVVDPIRYTITKPEPAACVKINNLNPKNGSLISTSGVNSSGAIVGKNASKYRVLAVSRGRTITVVPSNNSSLFRFKAYPGTTYKAQVYDSNYNKWVGSSACNFSYGKRAVPTPPVPTPPTPTPPVPTPPVNVDYDAVIVGLDPKGMALEQVSGVNTTELNRVNSAMGNTSSWIDTGWNSGTLNALNWIDNRGNRYTLKFDVTGVSGRSEHIISKVRLQKTVGQTTTTVDLQDGNYCYDFVCLKVYTEVLNFVNPKPQKVTTKRVTAVYRTDRVQGPLEDFANRYLSR